MNGYKLHRKREDKALHSAMVQAYRESCDSDVLQRAVVFSLSIVVIALHDRGWGKKRLSELGVDFNDLIDYYIGKYGKDATDAAKRDAEMLSRTPIRVAERKNDDN